MREHQANSNTSQSGLYVGIDILTEALIYVSIIFGPWAFGTVEPWSIRVLNTLGYILGGILTLKVALRFWFTAPQSNSNWKPKVPWQTHLQAGLTVTLLLFVAIHAWNARATFDPQTQTFSYIHTYIDWLPHSYDRDRTLQVLYQGVALACFFWATRDWLLTGPSIRSRKTLSPRLKRLLLVISLSGAALGIIALLQRMDGTNKLLWLVEPKIIKYAPWQFGSFAYRGNAASYFNLLWPLILLLVIGLRNDYKQRKLTISVGSGPHMAIAPLVGIAMICPMVTSSRAGAAVFAVQVIAIFVYAIKSKLIRPRQALASLIIMAFLGSLILFLGGGRSIERIRETIAAGGNQKGETRLDIFQHFPPLLKASPWGGFGPGSFSSVYILVRKTKINAHPTIPLSRQENTSLVLWAAWAHCDPVEIFLTFGPSGTALLTGFLLLVLVKKKKERRPNLKTRRFLILVAINGMILHSIIDFPFQIYSLIHLFTVILAILSSLDGASLTVGQHRSRPMATKRA